ncbi:MAG: AAA family ATPase [Actinobacteria bacterium]|nr:AAA family ATPase [Actinomycetota bacterium]MCG2808072.1 AAA family ATPase [Coriobacteriia bacterium]
MKIAISGKGGVGKTTLSSSLARIWASQGRRVIAIDADPDANLAAALGASSAQAAQCIPLSEMDDLIEERTGAKPGRGGMFILNPDVSDVVERCGVDIDGVTLLRTGTVERGGSGCMCSEGTFLKAFVHNLLVERDDIAVLDMEAGIEHLGRGTAEAVDAFVVVVEPGTRSVQTAHTVSVLARDLGVPRIFAVGNRVRGPEDIAYLTHALGEIELIGTLPESEAVRQADREGRSPFDVDPKFTEALEAIAAALVDTTTQSQGGA